LISASRGKSSLLVFTKADRSATIRRRRPQRPQPGDDHHPAQRQHPPCGATGRRPHACDHCGAHTCAALRQVRPP
jgi:hypothetical protein